jgi:hypothetical protein
MKDVFRRYRLQHRHRASKKRGDIPHNKLGAEDGWLTCMSAKAYASGNWLCDRNFVWRMTSRKIAVM